MKKSICVIIPAYNEEKVIERSLCALKKIVSKEHIFVVSDGSKDKTVSLTRRASVNVMALRKNVGKSHALYKLIKTRRLAQKYKYILFSDADGYLSNDFKKVIRPYIKQNYACIVGTVTSQRRGFISAFRTYEYGLSHIIYKNAQSTMQTITVAPGSVSLYRGDILEKLNFFGKTLTEDFDLTLQIHEKKLGRIIYVSKAKVITQDPLTIRDFWNQVLRWNTGFWQNLFLHKLYLPTRKINFEIILILLDFSAGIAALVYFAYHPIYLLHLFLSTILLTILLGILITSIKKEFWAIIYTPLFPILYFLNLSSFFVSFFRALFSKNLSWQKVVRYRL